MYPPPGVEDPISAIFDLSDRVAAMAPTMRRMYRYTATVVVLFLLIMVILLFVGLASNLGFAVLALVAIVFGGLALSLLRETDRFYESYLQRHRAIKLLQDADPTPKIPKGRTPVERLARYLAQSNRRLGEYLQGHPEALRYRVRLAGNGTSHAFDLMVLAPQSLAHRWLRLGDPGFVVLARVGPDVPTITDVDQFGQELKLLARRLPGRLSRVILLRVHPETIPESVYEYLVGHPVELPSGPVSLEIVSEQTDGTYDFVPHVLGIP